MVSLFPRFAPLSRPLRFRQNDDGGLQRPGPYRIDQLPLYGEGFLLRHELWRLKRNKLVYRWKMRRWRARSTMCSHPQYGLRPGSKPARPGSYKGPGRDPLPNLLYDPGMRDGAHW